MNIDKYYLVSIDKSAKIRTENIEKLKQSIRKYTGKDIQKFGVDGIKINRYINRHIIKILKKK